MPDILKKFTTLYPHIDITLTDASASNLDRLLNDEEIDLIIDTKDEEKKNCDYVPIVEETFKYEDLKDGKLFRRGKKAFRKIIAK